MLSIYARLPIYVALFCSASSGNSIGLSEAYTLALKNDPTYRGAIYEKDAGIESKTLGIANLLPSVNVSGNYSQNNLESISGTLQSRQYQSSTVTVSVRQPLINLDALARYRQGISQANYSDVKLSTQSQDLIARMISAYLSAILSESQLKLAVAQRDTLAENHTANQRSFELGAGTVTDVLEIQSRLEIAEANVLEAANNVENDRAALTAIIGKDPGMLDGLIYDFSRLMLMSNSVSTWEQTALQNNSELASQRFTVEYSEQEVNRSNAGHWPRLDFVASYSNNASDSIYAINQAYNVTSAGVQLGIPIYSGGSVNAQTRQAVAKLSQARSDQDALQKKILIEVQKQFNAFVTGEMRIKALQRAEQSANATIVATKKSIAGGQRINLDLLNALERQVTTQRDLIQARLTYLLAYIKLKAAAGVLGAEDIDHLSSHFQHSN